MSELKATTANDAYWKASWDGDRNIPVYFKSEADAVIAEKDKEIAELKQKLYDAEEGRNDYKLQYQEIFAELQSTKEKLHDAEKRADLAEAAATERKIDYDNLKKDLAYHARQIYFKHNRQTLRALWLARAERAKDAQTQMPYVNYYNNHQRSMYHAITDVAPYSVWVNRWNNTERLCRAKADMFKEDL